MSCKFRKKIVATWKITGSRKTSWVATYPVLLLGHNCSYSLGHISCLGWRIKNSAVPTIDQCLSPVCFVRKCVTNIGFDSPLPRSSEPIWPLFRFGYPSLLRIIWQLFMLRKQGVWLWVGAESNLSYDAGQRSPSVSWRLDRIWK